MKITHVKGIRLKILNAIQYGESPILTMRKEVERLRAVERQYLGDLVRKGWAENGEGTMI